MIGISSGVNGEFIIFSDIAWGIRALCTDLRTDMNQGLNTIKKLMYEYAPPSQNNTAAYIAYVVSVTGIGQDTPLQQNADTFKRLARAIMNYEIGVKYSAMITDASIMEGISRMSGTVPPGAAAAGIGISALVLIGAAVLFYKNVIQ